MTNPLIGRLVWAIVKYGIYSHRDKLSKKGCVRTVHKCRVKYKKRRQQNRNSTAKRTFSFSCKILLKKCYRCRKLTVTRDDGMFSYEQANILALCYQSKLMASDVPRLRGGRLRNLILNSPDLIKNLVNNESKASVPFLLTSQHQASF